MKHLSTLLVLTLLLASCKKEITPSQTPYVQNVQAALKESMQESDFMALDFSRPVLTKVDSVGLYLLRVPFKNKALRNDFVLLKTDKNGRMERGKMVHLEGRSTEFGEGGVKKRRFDGQITISSLDRKAVLHSRITNGFVEAFHGSANTRTESLMPSSSGETLPEVVVVASYNNYGISFSDWCYLQSFFYDSYGGGGSYSGGYYGSLDGGGGGYGGGSGSSGGDYDYYNGGVELDPPIYIDYETDISKSPIDLESYLRCFDQIPDAGATCSIEIYADIPVDSDPYKLFELSNQSPGHTFIQIKKSNGTQSAIQNIGFYPQSDWKSILTNAPIDGKFVDNGMHEFNASIKMSVSPENFKSILTEIRYLARFIKYDIDEYNCTDFALDVFNKIRTGKLEIPMYHIPGGMAAGGTRTPQGLYNKLQEMKSGGSSEAANITIGNNKNWVAYSSGACN